MVNMAGAWWAIAQERAAILVETQEGAIERAAEMCANAILNDGLVHTFGSGHSRVAVEELFPRYGFVPRRAIGKMWRRRNEARSADCTVREC